MTQYVVVINDTIDSQHVWCINGRDESLFVKSIDDQSELSLPYHQFGLASNTKFSIVNGADFEYNQQRYLIISAEIKSVAPTPTTTNAASSSKQQQQQYEHQTSASKYVMVIFRVAMSKVVCAFEVPHRVTKIETLVRNKHYYDSERNPTLLRNFAVTALCGCDGGAIQLFGMYVCVCVVLERFKQKSNLIIDGLLIKM